jgi:hypothetical protein
MALGAKSFFGQFRQQNGEPSWDGSQNFARRGITMESQSYLKSFFGSNDAIVRR